MGIERSTFIVDESGTITHVYRGVKVKGHVKALLEAL
jgi:peroxiredoxin Q/BCP